MFSSSLKEASAFCHLSGADDCVFAQRLRARRVKVFLLIVVFYTLMPPQQCSAAASGPVSPSQGFGVQLKTQTSSRLNSVTVTGWTSPSLTTSHPMKRQMCSCKSWPEKRTNDSTMREIRNHGHILYLKKNSSEMQIVQLQRGNKCFHLVLLSVKPLSSPLHRPWCWTCDLYLFFGPTNCFDPVGRCCYISSPVEVPGSLGWEGASAKNL